MFVPCHLSTYSYTKNLIYRVFHEGYQPVPLLFRFGDMQIWFRCTQNSLIINTRKTTNFFSFSFFLCFIERLALRRVQWALIDQYRFNQSRDIAFWSSRLARSERLVLQLVAWLALVARFETRYLVIGWPKIDGKKFFGFVLTPSVWRNFSFNLVEERKEKIIIIIRKIKINKAVLFQRG